MYTCNNPSKPSNETLNNSKSALNIQSLAEGRKSGVYTYLFGRRRRAVEKVSGLAESAGMKIEPVGRADTIIYQTTMPAIGRTSNYTPRAIRSVGEIHSAISEAQDGPPVPQRGNGRCIMTEDEMISHPAY